MVRSQGGSARFALLFVVALALGGCGAPSATPAPRVVTLAMGYVPNVQFAPFYVAVEKGFFADEAIQVRFDYGWETDLLKLVGGDELQFAIASGDQVILARSQGLPVVYVLNWYRRFPVCVMSLPEKGIQSPQDLVGRRVGTPAMYGASYIGWRAMLDVAGIPPTAVDLVSIGYTQVAAVMEGQVDAALCYAMNEPVQMEAAGREPNVLYVADFTNLVSNGLITNEKSVRERPELVQGMVRAALRGLAYTLAHPDDAFGIALRYVPEAASDPATQAVNRAILAKSIEFWQADAGQLGVSVAEEWAASQRIMLQMGLISTQTDTAAMFTNRFVREAER